MHKKWLYLGILSLIWGSSFILIKKGLVGLTAYQLGALRIVLTSLVLFSVGFKSLRQVRSTHWKWLAITGFVSSFFPPFFFAMAQNHIDSSVASILNSFTPLATVLVGLLLFGIYSTRRQLLGVFIGLAGTLLLIFAGSEVNPGQNYWASFWILIASVGYALNVNMIKKYLTDISALAVTTGNFLFIFLPALVVLVFTGYFQEIFKSQEMLVASGFILILSIVGTATAKVLFNKLIQVSSPVFASSVTYTIPLVAIFWGLFDGESFSVWQILAAFVVLLGVYLSNKKS